MPLDTKNSPVIHGLFAFAKGNDVRLVDPVTARTAECIVDPSEIPSGHWEVHVFGDRKDAEDFKNGQEFANRNVLFFPLGLTPLTAFASWKPVGLRNDRETLEDTVMPFVNGRSVTKFNPSIVDSIGAWRAKLSDKARYPFGPASIPTHRNPDQSVKLQGFRERAAAYVEHGIDADAARDLCNVVPDSFKDPVSFLTDNNDEASSTKGIHAIVRRHPHLAMAVLEDHLRNVVLPANATKNDDGEPGLSRMRSFVTLIDMRAPEQSTAPSP